MVVVVAAVEVGVGSLADLRIAHILQELVRTDHRDLAAHIGEEADHTALGIDRTESVAVGSAVAVAEGVADVLSLNVEGGFQGLEPVPASEGLVVAAAEPEVVGRLEEAWIMPTDLDGSIVQPVVSAVVAAAAD